MTSDERLQQLRRAWDEGDLETQVRLLHERMRAGDLSEERVRLAACLGSEAAACVSAPPGQRPDPLVACAQAGREGTVRAGLALLHGFAMSTPAALQIREGIEHAFVVGDSMQPLRDEAEAEIERCLEASRFEAAAEVHASLGFLRVLCEDYDPAELAAAVEQALGQLWLEGGSETWVRLELVPWALGQGDPVAERVAAREAGGSE